MPTRLQPLDTVVLLSASKTLLALAPAESSHTPSSPRPGPSFSPATSSDSDTHQLAPVQTRAVSPTARSAHQPPSHRRAECSRRRSSAAGPPEPSSTDQSARRSDSVHPRSW
ncbi:hypothetical protein OPT61_g7500 [Boeremia exigua]|uniref:Uncharacterized protein n=1 Tax=Boeremia exigua TaxID=749465 RepID=A0ACC2I328_9PLEO|nr:hypothetical protein OPT61_g7500 [Boeremia exigua]